MKKKEELLFDHYGQVDVEAIIDKRNYNTPPTEYIAPGKDRKWRSRDLLDIHWKLVGIECPASSTELCPACGRCEPAQRCVLPQAENYLCRDWVLS